MKTYIWSIPTRLFHWLLAISFAVAFILGGEEEFMNIHAAFGVLIGGLVLFRILQGIFGPRYVRFRDFPLSSHSISQFLTNMRESKALHPGHNPLASGIMLLIMLTALMSALSGAMIFATSDAGFLGVRLNPGMDSEFFGEFHETIVHVFLVLVGIHLAGILVDTIFHPAAGTIFSILTGYKRINAVPVTLSAYQKVFSVFWFLVPLAMFFYIATFQPLNAGSGGETEQVSGDEDGEEE